MKGLLQLLRSMRFAIAVLCVVAVAATIGSILEQNQPAVVYVGRYGAYWARLFGLCGLTDVYHAPWFLLLLFFMAASTALCLWQRTPGMWREMRAWRLERSSASLRRAAHQASFAAIGAQAGPLRDLLRSAGFGVRLKTFDGGWVLAGRRGAGRRAGYVLVHGAMVLICVGGLVDGNPGLRWQLWRGAVKPAPLDLPAGRAPASARLDGEAGAFRAMVTLARGADANEAVLAAGDGYLVQPLPFRLHLRDFTIERYPNGQPRDFVSKLEILDGARRIPVTLHVNQPFTWRGVTLFQSGFDDGGSLATLRLRGADNAPLQEIVLRVGEAAPLLVKGQPWTLEATELKTVNLFARGAAPTSWRSQSRPGAHTVDVGPSLSFRLRDSSGQAESFTVYRRALDIGGAPWFVLARGDGAATRYLRLPADGAGSLRGYLAWSAALHDAAARRRAAAVVAAGVGDPQLAATVRASAEALLARFADEGMAGIARLVPPAASQRQRLASGQLYLELLERSAAALAPALPQARVHDAMLAYSDRREGGWPALVELAALDQVPASVLQVTRAPGAALVYLGLAVLAAGVCAMAFVRERRIWLHWQDDELLLALDANRPTPGMEEELKTYGAAIAVLLHSPAASQPSTRQVIS